MKSIVLALSIAIFAANSFGAESVEDVSLLQLIAAPERFNGKIVRIIGYLHLELEEDAVYLHREDSEKSIFKNGVWIYLSDTQRKVANKLNNSYILIEGVFDSDVKGHFGLWGGGFKKIENLSKWSPVKGTRGEVTH